MYIHAQVPPPDVWFVFGESREQPAYAATGKETGSEINHGKRASSAVKTEELHQVGKRPARPLAFDFHGTFAGIPSEQGERQPV